MLKIKFLGSAMQVTGSRILLQYNKSKYLIDCGLFQGPRIIREQNWQTQEALSGIRALILTHAHIDHSGYIPKLVKDGFCKSIFCSDGTADLCRILLPDSGHLQEEDAYFANNKRISKHQPALPLYTEHDAIKSLQYLRPQPMDKWIELEQGLSFRLLRSGHILGSAFVQFSYDSGNGSKILTFSGDIGNGRSVILKEPLQLSETDDLVMESTYGDRVQPRGQVMGQFRDIINKVLKRGGTLLIPAFAVGRTQEILYMIHQLEKTGEIDKHDVYLDSPMALDATELYMKHPNELKSEIIAKHTVPSLSCARFTPVRTSDESMLLCMNTEPKIVISAAGMLTGGRIMHHLKSKLPDPKSGVLFVGYQVEGTKGHLLKNGLTDIRIHHQKVIVEAEIFSSESLSAHGDSNDIINWINGLNKKPNKIYLNHGEKSALEALQYRIKYELKIDALIAAAEEEYIINS